MDKLSYALGMSLAQNMINQGVEKIQFEDFLDGIKTVYLNRNPKIDVNEGNRLLKNYFDTISKNQEEQTKKEREENLKFAEEYMKENLKVDGMKATSSGLQFKVIREAKGNPYKSPTAHDRVKCHYEGRLTDGTIFDSSYQRGEPAVFSLDQVIPGWTEGLQLMGEGDKYEFIIPPALGYGEVGIPGHIPGNSVLTFVVELISVL